MIIRRETEEGERQRIMMVQFKWIQMSLFVTAMLQFTGAAENLPASFTVTVGDDVTLTCENVKKPQQQCNSTTWTFSGLGSKQAVELVKLGQIGEDVKAKDRLSVTEKCSLVIKKVTVEDVGRYICQQYKYREGPKSSSDSVVHLSVVSMTEHQNHDEVTLNCSVWTYEPCRHTVKWLYEGKEVDTDNGSVTTSQSLCSASVRAPSHHHIYKSEFESVQCSVTDGDKEQQLFPFRLQSSGKKPGETTTTTATTATTTTTAATTTTTTTTTATAASSDTSRTERTNTTGSGTDGSTSELQRNWLWLLIILAVVLVALLIIVVKVIRRKRAEENNTRMEDDVGLTSNPAVTQSAPGTSQSTADPGDGVCYASISYTRNTNRRDRAQGNDGDDDDDDDEAVTYTTIKASSLSAGASADPSNLYATVNKPKK
ncbi:uncharacterized protein LOC119012497 isoform X2 [Acanthopagrus latus]|uniref:uncharacterized protein LOC119012497 isoform X2 n=1 Tax=Acanthopagrus latus TaxID=8177 RepID=UPI00187C50E6|nr:uncharacterized protein LOC119012497 isoform X2 [Acanthopagrus latus]